MRHILKRLLKLTGSHCKKTCDNLRLGLMWLRCADSRTFVSGVRVHLTEKALTLFLLFCFVRGFNGYFQETITFQDSRGGPIFSRRGVQLFPGGGGPIA